MLQGGIKINKKECRYILGEFYKDIMLGGHKILIVSYQDFEGKHTTLGKKLVPRVPRVPPSVIRPNFELVFASLVHSAITPSLLRRWVEYIPISNFYLISQGEVLLILKIYLQKIYSNFFSSII